MATETFTDVYKFEGAGAEAAMKRLSVLTREFTVSLAIQTKAAVEMSVKMTEMGNRSEQTEKSLQKQAVALDRLAKETRETAKATKSMSDFLKDDLKNSLIGTQAQYELLKRAMFALAGFAKDSVLAFAASERGNNQLTNAMAKAGFQSETMREALDKLANGFEATTGTQNGTVKEMLALMLQMGIAPSKFKALTEATLDYASANKKDAVTALKEVIGGIRGEQEHLGKLKLSFEGVTDAAERTDMAVQQIMGTFGGDAKTNMADTHGALVQLKNDWAQLEENVGEALVQMSKVPAGVMFLLGPLAAMPSQLREASGALKILFGKDVADLEEGAKALEGIGSRVAIIKKTIFKDPKPEKKEKQEKPEKNPWLENALYNLQKQKEDELQIERDYQETLAKLEKEGADFREKVAKSNISKANDAAKDRLELERKAAKERTQLLEDEAQAVKDHWEEVQSTFADFAADMVDTALDGFRQSLLANTQFNQEYKAKSFERRVEDEAEQQARRDIGDEQFEELSDFAQRNEIANRVEQNRAKVAKMTAQEEAAAQSQKVAEVLAGLAQQAAAQAIFAAAEGFALLPNFVLAGPKFQAAAMFGLVAAGAGVAAAGISGARGNTREEREQLDSLNRRDSDRRERENRTSSERGKGDSAGTQVNVYYYGIAGQTETEQAAELERLRRKYNNLQTGGG